MLLAAAGKERAAQPLRICELCVELVGVTGAGISMVTATRNRGIVCATDEVAEYIETLQLEAGEGPCVDAANHRGPVMVADLRDHGDVLASRWPVFLPGAIDAGVGAVFALPLWIGAIGVGVLDLYRRDPGPLTETQLAFTLMAADAAALALLYVDRDDLAGEGHLPDGTSVLREAAIHQATGMVSVQLGVSVEEALLMLRARAYASERPLKDVARDVVELRLRFSSEEDA